MSTNEEVTLNSIMDSISSMKQSFQESIATVQSTHELIAWQRPRDGQSQEPPPPRRKEPESSRRKAAKSVEPERSTSTHWADRSDTVHDLCELTDEDFADPNEDEYDHHQNPETQKLSEETEHMLTRTITSTLDNLPEGRFDVATQSQRQTWLAPLNWTKFSLRLSQNSRSMGKQRILRRIFSILSPAH